MRSDGTDRDDFWDIYHAWQNRVAEEFAESRPDWADSKVEFCEDGDVHVIGGMIMFGPGTVMSWRDFLAATTAGKDGER